MEERKEEASWFRMRRLLLRSVWTVSKGRRKADGRWKWEIRVKCTSKYHPIHIGEAIYGKCVVVREWRAWFRKFRVRTQAPWPRRQNGGEQVSPPHRRPSDLSRGSPASLVRT